MATIEATHDAGWGRFAGLAFFDPFDHTDGATRRGPRLQLGRCGASPRDGLSHHLPVAVLFLTISPAGNREI